MIAAEPLHSGGGRGDRRGGWCDRRGAGALAEGPPAVRDGNRGGLIRVKAATRRSWHSLDMSVRFTFFLVAIAAAVLVPQTKAVTRVFDVAGVIRAPMDANGRITVAHENIAGLMPAMTMKFAVDVPAEAASLQAGDEVRFRLHVNDAVWTASDFVVVGREAIPPPIRAVASSTGRVREGDGVPEFALTTEAGEPLASSDLRGHVTLLTFIFTRCPVPEYCPAMALRFAQIQKAILADPKLAQSARLLSITLDPEFDRPAVLKAYGEAVGANPAVWEFATGSTDDIAALTKSFAVFNERNGVTLDHTLCTALVGADGRVREIWRGNGWRVDEVVAAIASAAQK